MNLLPKSHTQFSDAEYWNTFFRKRGKKAFEWYGNYTELCDFLHKYIRPQDEILEIGCGNSNLAADLYDAGFWNLTSIDISSVVVRQMQQKRPDVRYMQMDALKMNFTDGAFSVVLDKGTLDALMPAGAAVEEGRRLCEEVARVTRPGGRFVCMSLLQEHIARHLLKQFSAGWFVRVVRCPDSGRLPVFGVVCTKLVVAAPRVLELCLTGEQVRRLSEPDELLAAVRSVQQVAMVCAGIREHSLESDLAFELEDARTGATRYTVHVVEAAKVTSNMLPYGALIVPQGRETEWMFSTEPGRRQLVESARCRRLAVVSLHRGQVYTDLDAVKEEIGAAVQSFAPSLPAAYRIPIMSVGEDVGRRETRHHGTSDVSGDFVIEDCTCDNVQVRRLVFLANQNIVQSEARLLPDGKVDSLHLSCRHHVAMSVGCVATGKEGAESRILIVGLGGGGLCTFVSRCLPHAHLTAVDLDPAMRDLAVEWFGLQLGSRLQVDIADGLVYLEEARAACTLYDAILFDVDSKDGSVGLSCPPRAFLDATVLEAARACLPEDGLLIVNLAARDPVQRKWAIQQLQDVFKPVASYQVPDELNEVFFCARAASGLSSQDLVARLISAAATLDVTVRQLTHKRAGGNRRRRRGGKPHNQQSEKSNEPDVLDLESFKKALVALDDNAK